MQGMITRASQDIERTLELCNIRITSLVSNINIVSVCKVVEKIINGEDTVEELACCIHSRIINSKGDMVRHSLEGHIQEHHRIALSMTYEQLKLFTEQSAKLEDFMKQICEAHYNHELELLMSIPGVARQAAMQIIAETGGNMKAFDNSGKLTGWTGLRPRNDESAGKYKSTATTNGNKYLRRILVQSAWAATRVKESYYRSKFEQLCIRKSRKKALIAIARKLLTVVWHVLEENKYFNPGFMPVYNPKKLEMKMRYHQREMEKLLHLGFNVT